MDREMCTSLLPIPVQSDGSWLIGVHIHRSSAAQTRHTLRGTKPHRELPHLYFVQAVEATLRAISLVEPSAKVNIAVFSNGRWGSIVDDTGVPFTWDIPAHICKEVGLSCTQVSKPSRIVAGPFCEVAIRLLCEFFDVLHVAVSLCLLWLLQEWLSLIAIINGPTFCYASFLESGLSMRLRATQHRLACRICLELMLLAVILLTIVQ